MNVATFKTPLFGPDRNRLGPKDQEWSVWTSGMDHIHNTDSLSAALELANQKNAAAAQLRYGANSLDDPSHLLGAVVLHWGYAWTADTEYRLGVDCGKERCDTCTPRRTTTAN